MTSRYSILLFLAAAAAAQSVYQEPDSHFTVLVPPGWQVAKVPNRAATVTVSKGKAFVNLSAEPSTMSAADALKNYERLIAQNCPQYHETERGAASLGGISGLGLSFTCNDPRQGYAAMSVGMAVAHGQLAFFYSMAPADQFDALKGDIDAMRNTFRMSASPAPAAPPADTQKLAALQQACAAGVFTPEECAAKRAALTGGAAPPPQPPSPPPPPQAAANGGQVYRDPRGRFSVTAPAGWSASPMGDGGADGVGISHGSSWIVITPYTASVNAPGDVVNEISNQIQPQYRDFKLIAHNAFKVGVHEAAYAMFTGVNKKGVSVSLTISGIAAGGGHFLTVVSSAPMEEAQASSPVFNQISQSIRFAGE